MTRFTVHHLSPMIDGQPERWSVVGNGPVAYCDSPRLAERTARKLNTRYGKVCPSCSAARTIRREQVAAAMTRFLCLYCETPMTIRPR